MTHLMTLDELRRHISVLASPEETSAPFVSAYFNLEEGLSVGRFRRLIAKGSPRVKDYAAHASLVAASKAGAGP